MLIWAMFDCRYKLDQIGVRYASWKEQKRRKEVLNHNPADWIGTSSRLDWLQSSRLDSKAETPKLKLKNPVDWMVIQATGLIVQNQAETPDFNFEESSRLDGDPGDWIN
jgi:hypothetical protein